MSFKIKTPPATEVVTCEKYINKMLKSEKACAMKRAKALSPAYQEKVSTILKQPFPPTVQKQKPKPNVRQQNPIPKPTPPIYVNPSTPKDDDIVEHSRPRTRSRCRSASSDRESWKQILHKNRSKEKISNFSNFDPLRTIHFLTKELHTKLQNILPDDDSVIQMVSDIQHALKRIPSKKAQELEKFCVVKAPMANKHCQTPPTLYQEDTEKFQKIMEENTFRLEASCKQLEIVCTNLQKEKETTEQELEEARDRIEALNKRIKEIETETAEKNSVKIRQLEIDKECLRRQLNKALEEPKDNASVISLKKHIEHLEKQKSSSEENCAKLQYDMTLLKMEKEKFITMLSVRDREIKEIQEEMYKIQDQVNNQLKKLNIEMLPRVDSLKSLSDPSCNVKDAKDILQEIGDSTISTIRTNDPEDNFALNELPCGDGGKKVNKQNVHEDLAERLSRMKPSSVETHEIKGNSSFEELIKGFSPSCRALITSSNS